MLKRIATGWTWIRAAYFLIGTFVIVQSAFEGEWIGILLGAWPAAMGLFGLACVGGNCSTGTCEVRSEDSNR
ncbi:hypothetical protein [Salegentibacter sp. T436]|jgi:hypothetical protein|uniref:hypothetical protein n=1 Tax=Salegentibacter sp. T436 TaxID=1729720 RepID=UPI00094A9A30|nr:hypothetical protein [Salegentibacter sp. T436]APS38962.1 hypothetical protein AO058_08815 [Salegentibacter sp. T436]|tara:strand:- start:282 stop:497 length:216 start_codon:yes stop_codon:yes gene_type:complete